MTSPRNSWELPALSEQAFKAARSSQSFVHNHTNHIRETRNFFLVAPDGLQSPHAQPESNSVTSTEAIPAACVVAKCFSHWAFQLWSDWKPLSKISQWLTTVWKLQHLVIYCCLTPVGISDCVAMNKLWRHKTRTLWYGDSSQMIQEDTWLREKAVLKKQDSQGWELPSQIIYYIGIRIAILRAEKNKLKKNNMGTHKK